MGKYWVLACYNPRLISNFVYSIGNARDDAMIICML